MAKLTTFIIILSVLVLLFHMGGVVAQSSFPSLLGLLLNPQSLQGSGLDIRILLGINGVILTSAIILGIVSKNFELVAAAPIALFLLNIMMDFIAVYTVLRAENQVVANLLISPIMLLFFVTIFDWWRGRD